MIRHRQGTVSVEVDTRELEAMVMRAVEKSAPTLLPILRAERDRILAEAQSNWPVRTGKSKRGLVGYEKVTKDGIEVGIKQHFEYGYYVRGNIHAGRNSWQETVAKPMKRAEGPLAEECADDLRKLVENG